MDKGITLQHIDGAHEQVNRVAAWAEIKFWNLSFSGGCVMFRMIALALLPAMTLFAADLPIPSPSRMVRIWFA
jgi:hypothetical protein